MGEICPHLSRFVIADRIYYLLGIAHAHFDEEQLNMGIAVVVPASKILEVIDQPMMKDREQEIEDEKRKQKGATLDSLTPGHATDGDELTRERFFNILHKVSRPDQPPSDEEKPETSEL